MKSNHQWTESELLRLAQRTARLQGLRVEDAEDVASSVVTLYIESKETIRFPAAWVKLVAKRKSWAFNRHESVLLRGDEDALEGASPRLPLGDHPLERKLDLRAALGTLGDEERDILLLRDMAGEGIEAIAGKTGLSLATVKRRLRGGRASLKRALSGTSLRPLRLAGEAHGSYQSGLI